MKPSYSIDSSVAVDFQLIKEPSDRKRPKYPYKAHSRLIENLDYSPIKPTSNSQLLKSEPNTPNVLILAQTQGSLPSSVKPFQELFSFEIPYKQTQNLLSLDRFLYSSLAEIFVCKVCKNVCRFRFVECLNCSGLYCRECIEGNLCPECGRNKDVSFLSRCTQTISSPNLALVHSLLELRCLYCSESMQLKHLHTHEEACQLKPMSCKASIYNFPGCKLSIPCKDSVFGFCSSLCESLFQLVSTRSSLSDDEFKNLLLSILNINKI